MRDVISQFQKLLEQKPHARLYALVDGLQYEQCFEQRIEQDSHKFPLFQGTQDEPLAHAGPWLFDLEGVQAELMAQLEKLEQSKPAVSWLFASADMHGLAQLLQLRLNLQLPDGQISLLRFYDPRVLYGICNSFTPEQMTQLCEHIEQWHFMYDGKRQVLTRRT
jgi:Domain of unknown function (DUF4123)